MSTNPTLSESVLVSLDPLNPITPQETMVNQPDETYISANPLNQFLSNPNNAQMVEEIIEKHKHLILSHVVAQGMTIMSSDTPITASLQESPQ